MSESIAVPAPEAVAARAPAPSGAEVLAAGLAVIGLAVAQLVALYGLPFLEWKAYRQHREMSGFAQLFADLNHFVGDWRWVAAIAWVGAAFVLRRKSWRGAFVVGTSLLAIAFVALALTMIALSSLTFLFPEV